MLLRFIFLSWMLIFSLPALHAQVPARDTLDITRFKTTIHIRTFCLWYKDSLNDISEEHLDQIKFTDTVPHSVSGATLVDKTIYLKCIIRNDGDSTLREYFIPGFYFRMIRVFEFDSLTGKINILPRDPKDFEGFRLIRLKPHTAKLFFFKLKTVKADNMFDPSMVPDYFRMAFLFANQEILKYTIILTFVISGIMLMMIFYSLAVYFLNRDISFLLYSGYAFFLGLMFFLIAFTFREPSRFAYFFVEYLDFILQSIGTFFYLAFLGKFLNSRNSYPLIHRLIQIEKLSIVISSILFSYTYFFTNNFPVQNYIELVTKFFWMVSTVIFVVLAIREKNTLLDYLAAGHAILILFASVSFYFILFKPHFPNAVPEIFKTAIFYFEVGVCIELVFFLAALASKNKRDIIDRTKESERLKIKSERQELEQQLAVISAKQEERNRISADMHDELGSGLTAIRLMSEILKQKMKPVILPEINRISHSANELINKSNTLIWTMKSENDTLESLVAYIRIYALEFFENTSINCTVKMPDLIRSVELSGEKRRNIFLAVKETLNNILKHSKAEVVRMVFDAGDDFVVRITDDGVGIEFDKLRQFGSGLTNMKKRIEGIGGRYTITNNENGGATTLIELAI